MSLTPADDSPHAILLPAHTSKADGLTVLVFVIRTTLHVDLVTDEDAFAPIVRLDLGPTGEAGPLVPWLGTRVTTEEQTREVFGEVRVPARSPEVVA